MTLRYGRHCGARRRAGYTFMEIMIVVVIIGILASVVVPSLLDILEEGKRAATKQQMKSVQTALMVYYRRVDEFPSTDQGLVGLTMCPVGVEPDVWGERPMLPDLPLDGWGRRYVYRCPGEHGIDYDLFSRGRDNEEGTDDDITSWGKRAIQDAP